MKTLEILFTNRRKEKLAADTISLTEAPGWVLLKTDGVVAEMISASVIKRIRFVPDPAKAQEPPVPALGYRANKPASTPEHLLKLPLRPSYVPARPQPIVPSRRFV